MSCLRSYMTSHHDKTDSFIIIVVAVVDTADETKIARMMADD